MKIWGHNCTAQIKYFSIVFQIVCLKVADPKGTWDSLWIDGSYASNGDITVFFGAEMIFTGGHSCGGRVPTRDVLNKCQGLFGAGAQQFIENNRTRTRESTLCAIALKDFEECAFDICKDQKGVAAHDQPTATSSNLERSICCRRNRNIGSQ